MDLVLNTQKLNMNFGGLAALAEVDFQAERGAITALIGPNGAGKTTFFNCITGIYPPSSGTIVYLPEKERTIVLQKLTPDRVTTLGIARTFQNIRLFNNLTVLENVLIACHSHMKAGLWGAIFRNKRTLDEEKKMLDFSYELLVSYGLSHVVNQIAKTLPYGDQRRLEIVRALATRPKLLLLDEPAAGLNITETKVLEDLIKQIRVQENLSILLIEHDMSLVMSISDTVFVMEYGKMIAQGKPLEIQKNPQVIRAYLGEE
ncbi:MAG: ABC transporter ATP-binding protein [Deltaproteobacteria bacterium]|nr:ABC transporter ATP-binding protein [Deltaproteobacteria bacterium]